MIFRVTPLFRFHDVWCWFWPVSLPSSFWSFSGWKPHITVVWCKTTRYLGALLWFTISSWLRSRHPRFLPIFFCPSGILRKMAKRLVSTTLCPLWTWRVARTKSTPEKEHPLFKCLLQWLFGRLGEYTSANYRKHFSSKLQVSLRVKLPPRRGQARGGLVGYLVKAGARLHD